MLLNGTLNDHVAEIDRQAEEMLDRLTKQMAAQEGITEQLKVSDQMAWVDAMNNIRARAEEVVRAELIYNRTTVERAQLHKLLLLSSSIPKPSPRFLDRIHPYSLYPLSRPTDIFFPSHLQHWG